MTILSLATHSSAGGAFAAPTNIDDGSAPIGLSTPRTVDGGGALIDPGLSTPRTVDGGGALIDPKDYGQLKLPDSRELAYRTLPIIDAPESALPQVDCVGHAKCTIESSGTAGSVRLNIFALSSRAKLDDIGPGSVDIVGVYDSQGKWVKSVEDFDCEWQTWVDGEMLSCSNTSPDFKVDIPAGGSLRATAGLSVFVEQPNVWAVGHDFADKNHPQTTVWDYTASR